MDTIALILSIVGSLNWGLVGIFQFDLVSYLFGGQGALISRIVYTLVGAAEAMDSDVTLAQRLRSAWENAGVAVTPQDRLVLDGSEDFATMMHRVQQKGGEATFFRVLTKCCAGAHNRRFDFDESCLQTAVRAFCLAVYALMK